MSLFTLNLANQSKLTMKQLRTLGVVKAGDGTDLIDPLNHYERIMMFKEKIKAEYEADYFQRVNEMIIVKRGGVDIIWQAVQRDEKHGASFALTATTTYRDRPRQFIGYIFNNSLGEFKQAKDLDKDRLLHQEAEDLIRTNAKLSRISINEAGHTEIMTELMKKQLLPTQQYGPALRLGKNINNLFLSLTCLHRFLGKFSPKHQLTIQSKALKTILKMYPSAAVKAA